MTDGSALIKCIIDNPDCDTPRLVYADWLDENDGNGSSIREACANADVVSYKWCDGCSVKFTRGFAQEITCSTGYWLSDGRYWSNYNPITRVNLYDQMPFPIAAWYFWSELNLPDKIFRLLSRNIYIDVKSAELDLSNACLKLWRMS